MNIATQLARSLLIACALAAFQSKAYATPIIQSTSGLADPDITIEFSEKGLSLGTVTNQFSDLGVSFSPGLSFFNSVSSRPNFAGPALLNFTGDQIFINFGFDVSAVSFAFTRNNGIVTTFESLLDGVSVETFSSPSAEPVSTATNNFFGFTGSKFDQIRIGGTQAFALDTLSLTAAVEEVPSPAPAVLMLFGLTLLATRRIGSGL